MHDVIEKLNHSIVQHGSYNRRIYLMKRMSAICCRLCLLEHLASEKGYEMIQQGLKTAYSIARSLSPAMNITFVKNGYKYGGTLGNNTNIAGRIESMNIWYKHL